MIKLFDGYILVSDMDGTLLNSNGEISEANKNAIKYFVTNGGLFTIATGRMTDSVRRFLPDLEIDLPVIVYNGAKIHDYRNEETIHEDYIEEERKEIVKKIQESAPQLGIEVFSDEKNYIVSKCKYTDRLATSVCDLVYDLPKELWSQKWTKILIIGEPDEVDQLEREFNKICDKAIPIRSGSKFLEIVPDFTSKGTALKSLIDKYCIDSSKVIAVGDNMNDKEMIESAFYGFTIGNGEKRLIENAKYITPSNDEDAIEYVINWIEKRINSNK